MNTRQLAYLLVDLPACPGIHLEMIPQEALPAAPERPWCSERNVHDQTPGPECTACFVAGKCSPSLYPAFCWEQILGSHPRLMLRSAWEMPPPLPQAQEDCPLLNSIARPMNRRSPFRLFGQVTSSCDRFAAPFVPAWNRQSWEAQRLPSLRACWHFQEGHSSRMRHYLPRVPSRLQAYECPICWTTLFHNHLGLRVYGPGG